jgi:Tfp pilus assembly protein PilX
MIRQRGHGSKGIMLFIVLVSLLIVTMVINIILGFIVSHYQFTMHMVGRSRAYYAAMAGLNYTFEMLRSGAWPVPGSGSVYACMHGAIDPSVSCTYNMTDDSDIPYQIQVRIWAQGEGSKPIASTAQLEIKVK